MECCCAPLPALTDASSAHRECEGALLAMEEVALRLKLR